jgi:hypothetical protein
MSRLPLEPQLTILVAFVVFGSMSLATAATVTPTPMKLKINTLVTKAWNSTDDAFGLRRGQEGPTIGPAAVAYDKGRIFVLDTVKSCFREFDKSGNAVSTVVLPFAEPTDLVVDPATSSLLVVGQGSGELCKVDATGALARLPSVDMKWLVFPAKFAYETNSSTLFAQDAAAPRQLSPVLRGGVALAAELRAAVSAPAVTVDLEGHNLILSFGDGTQSIAVDMGRDVFCVEDVVTDDQGAVWALYTLEGDYRMRRLLRVDVAKGAAGVAVMDVWFAFDATRHMAAMENGVVLFAGDLSQGRIVTAQYAGGVRQ